MANGEISGYSPSAYRPICLLDEVGELLERVIAARLKAHMTQRESGWHDSQYGFQQGRSTVDAVGRVRSMAEDVVLREGVALAVSLDVTNAFNTIPWARIVEALRYYEVPAYLVIQAYFSDRWVTYVSKDGEVRRPVERGVPQGSVLGPILCITAYARVLRCPMPPGAGLVCYATIPWYSLGSIGGTRLPTSRRTPWRVRCHPGTRFERVTGQIRGPVVL
jgi:hypothetical protein